MVLFYYFSSLNLALYTICLVSIVSAFAARRSSSALMPLVLEKVLLMDDWLVPDFLELKL